MSLQDSGTNVALAQLASEFYEPEDDGIVRRTYEFRIERASKDDGERTFEVLASDSTVDSYGEVVEQFWDLGRFTKNGPVLWNHRTRSIGGDIEAEFPVGQAQLTATPSGLRGTVKIGTAAVSRYAELVYQGLKEGTLRGFSVGFYPGDVREVKDSDGTTRIHLGSRERPNVLAELSAVPIGANQNSVRLSAANRKQLESLRARAAGTAAQPAALGGENQENRMDKEQQSLLDAAEKRGREIAALEAKSQMDALTRAHAEKCAALEKDLADTRAELDRARGELCKSSIQALVGQKLVASEVEHYVKFAQAVGLESVLKSLEARPTLTILSSVDAPQTPVERSIEQSADIGSIGGQALAALFSTAVGGRN